MTWPRYPGVDPAQLGAVAVGAAERWATLDPAARSWGGGGPEGLVLEPHQVPPLGRWFGWLAMSGRGAGKPLSADTPIPTPSGWTTMGKLQIGDTVFTHDGTPTTVIDAYDPGVTEAWRVTFNDGMELTAGAGHEWTVIHDLKAQGVYRTERDLRQQHADWWRWRACDVSAQPVQPKLPPPEIVERARALHLHGLSWRKIEDLIGLEFPSTRSSERNRIRLRRAVYGEPQINYGNGKPLIVGRTCPASARYRATVVTTAEIAVLRDRNRVVWIPTTLPLDLPTVDLPVDPYVFGAWLGDGGTDRGDICAGQQDVDHLRAQLTVRGYGPLVETRDGNGVYDLVSRRLIAELKSIGLTRQIGQRRGERAPAKCVPDAFLRASAEQRLELVRGLMDTDGSIGGGYSACAGFVNENIADALYDLAVGLGWVTWRRTRWLPSTAHRPVRPFFIVHWRPTPERNPFHLPRKAELVTPIPRSQASRKTIRRVMSVVRVEDQQLRCIAVDAESRLFLAGRGMVPTHNTFTMANWINEHAKGPPCHPGAQPHRIAIIAPTQGDAVDACVTGPSGLKTINPAVRLLPSAPGGTSVVWPNGSRARLFGAQAPEDVERLRAGGGTCLAAGTLVETERGRVPIECVRVGDRVWTRRGLRQILGTFDNGVHPVMALVTTGGRTIVATPDHKLPTDRGDVELQFLQPGDKLTAWNIQGSSSTMEDGTDGVPTVTTSAQHETKRSRCFTELSGLIRTDQSHQGIEFTTEITTGQTTKSVIFRHSRRASTRVNTWLTGTVRPGTRALVVKRSGSPETLLMSPVCSAVTRSEVAVWCPPRSADVPPASLRWLRERVGPHVPGTHGCVRCAAKSSRPPGVTQLAHALQRVGLWPPPVLDWSDTEITGPASDAAVLSVLQSSTSTHTDRGLLVQDTVLAVLELSNERRVYDLMVEDDHAFIANGIVCLNCRCWFEELAAWRYLDDVFDQAMFGLRLGPDPRWGASTTPKPKPKIKQLNKDGVEVPHDSPLPFNTKIVITRATTDDNPHLMAHIREALFDTYGGRTLGQQELYGRVVDQDEAALWRREDLDTYRVRPEDAPEMRKISVGVDPSGGAGEQGIVVVGRLAEVDVTPEGKRLTVVHGYTLADMSCRLSPAGWGRRAVTAAVDHDADDIVVETNYGGDMAVATLRGAADQLGVNISIRTVTASRGKRVRAEPVAALSERGRWHMVGVHDLLEDQLCFPAGTLVETARGHVPIELVTADDQVMTREGFAPVAWAGKTGETTRLLELVHEQGCVLSTPCHRVWSTERHRFVPAWTVRPSDHLVVRHSLASMGHRLPGAGDGGAGCLRATTETLKAGSSIGRSGVPMLVKSHLATSSTISTTTRGTTCLRTFNCSPISNTDNIMASAVPGQHVARLRPRNAGPNGLGESRVPTSVSTAARHTSQNVSGPSSVVRSALHTLPSSVAVYDVTVRTGYPPEFYANGVLVHNCTWSEDSGYSPDRLDAMVWPAWHLRIVSVFRLAGETSFAGSAMANTRIG